MAVKHKFVSAVADGGDSTLVRPSNWNDSHSIVWSRITSGTTAVAGEHYVAVVSSQTDLTLPSLATGDEFVAANSGDSTANLRIVVGGSVTVNNSAFATGDNILVAPGQTVHLVAESTTELDIV